MRHFVVAAVCGDLARSRGRAAAVAGLVLALAAGSVVFALGGALDGLVFLPALLLLLGPLLGRYPGEAALARLTARRRGLRSRARSQRTPRRLVDVTVPALRLLAASRQLRGPPAPSPAR